MRPSRLVALAIACLAAGLALAPDPRANGSVSVDQIIVQRNWVIHCGRQLATAEARLFGPDGTLFAHATTTCLVFDMPAAR